MMPKTDKNYKLTGKVVHGAGEGKKLGFPTANLELDGASLEVAKNVATGVHAVKVEIYGRGREQRSGLFGLIHIGPRSTFGEEKLLYEVYIFDFDEDIYGEVLTVGLLEYIRPTAKFESIEALVEQMDKDVVSGMDVISRLYPSQE